MKFLSDYVTTDAVNVFLPAIRLLCVYLIKEVLSSEHAEFFFFFCMAHEHRPEENSCSSLIFHAISNGFILLLQKYLQLKCGLGLRTPLF